MPSIIDLSVSIEEGIPHSGLNPPAPQLWETYSHGVTKHVFEPFEDPELNPEGAPFSYQNETMVLSSHTATHVDAPSHVDPDSDVDVASIDPERLYSECLKLDVRDAVAPGGAITVDHLEAACTDAGVDDGDVPGGLFIQTGWSRFRTTDPERYLRWYPGVSTAAVKWIIERDVRVLGVDAPNVDRPDDARQPAHAGLLRRGWPDSTVLVENLTDLDSVPTPAFTVLIAPLPIVGASGSPARVIAIVE